MPGDVTIPAGISSGAARAALQQITAPGKLSEGLTQLGRIQRLGLLGDGDAPKIIACLEELRSRLPNSDQSRVDEYIAIFRRGIPGPQPPLAPAPASDYSAPAPPARAARERGVGVEEEELARGEEEARLVAAAYRMAVTEVDAELQAVGARVAARLQASFNAYVKTMPQSNYEDKQAVAKWVNAELKARGLALRCPKSGEASFLLVDTGRNPATGRFQFYHSEEGKPVRTANRNVLPDLVLVPRAVQEPEEGWVQGEARRRATRSPREKT
jgi:hypothetical protein